MICKGVCARLHICIIVYVYFFACLYVKPINAFVCDVKLCPLVLHTFTPKARHEALVSYLYVHTELRLAYKLARKNVRTQLSNQKIYRMYLQTCTQKSCTYHQFPTLKSRVIIILFPIFTLLPTIINITYYCLFMQSKDGHTLLVQTLKL